MCLWHSMSGNRDMRNLWHFGFCVFKFNVLMFVFLAKVPDICYRVIFFSLVKIRQMILLCLWYSMSGNCDIVTFWFLCFQILCFNVCIFGKGALFMLQVKVEKNCCLYFISFIYYYYWWYFFFFWILALDYSSLSILKNMSTHLTNLHVMPSKSVWM